MKAGRFIYMLPILFAGTTLFYFSTCPFVNIGSGNSGFSSNGNSNLYQPS